MSAVFKFFWAFLPFPIPLMLLAFISALVVFLVFKIVSIVLDAIPFL